MYLSEAARRAMADRLATLEELRVRFRGGKLPYPSSNMHISEEICATILLGCAAELRVATLRPEQAPYFMEWRARLMPTTGVVMHMFSAYYPFYLEDLCSRELAAEYVDTFLRPGRRRTASVEPGT
jgi:hypothetical protein